MTYAPKPIYNKQKDQSLDLHVQDVLNKEKGYLEDLLLKEKREANIKEREIQNLKEENDKLL